MPRSILPIPRLSNPHVTRALSHVPDAIAALRRAQASTSLLQLSECLSSCAVYLKAAQASLKTVVEDESQVLHVLGLSQQAQPTQYPVTPATFIPTYLLKETV